MKNVIKVLKTNSIWNFSYRGSIEIDDSKVSVEIYAHVVKLLQNTNWVIFVMGHSSRGEVSLDGRRDAFELSSARATAVTRSLIRRGVKPSQITTSFFGDTRTIKLEGRSEMEKDAASRRVEFIIRKVDLGHNGHKVDAQ